MTRDEKVDMCYNYLKKHKVKLPCVLHVNRGKEIHYYGGGIAPTIIQKIDNGNDYFMVVKKDEKEIHTEREREIYEGKKND